MTGLKSLVEVQGKKLKPAEGWRTYLLVTLLILSGGILVSYLIAADIARRYQNQYEEGLEGANTYFLQAFNRRMDSYAEVLRAGASLSTIAGDVTQSQWQEFVEGFDMKNRYPGTRVVGYAEHVTDQELQAHLASLDARGVDPYKLTPAGEREVYVPIVYAELVQDISAPETFGFDIYSDAERRQALDFATESAQTTMTNPIALRGDQSMNNKAPGLALYFPVYSQTQAPSSPETRRALITGFTFITFNMESLIIGLFGEEALANEAAGLQIKAKVDGGEDIDLYTSPTFNTVASQAGAITKTTEMDVHHKPLTATIVLGAGSGSSGSLINPKLVLAVGILTSIIVTFLVFVVMMNHLFKTTQKQEAGVQQAKEELLSLASHQLRTPASGVKQYLGILLQGYAGKLTDEQISLLHKAYESNERQLETVNQLLFVAKADAEQIRLVPSWFNLTKLVKKSVANHADFAASKNIQLSFRRSSPLKIYADPTFISLIADNLISNAVKYSYPNSTVGIALNSNDGQLHLRVRDNGVGVDPKHIDKIFQKFSRLKSELSEEAGGIGIGLYLSYELAKLHGGTIEVAAAPNGKGSEFTLILPGVKAPVRSGRAKAAS